MGGVGGELSGKVAIITGASSGIGRATALAMAGEGIRLVLAARREDRLRELAGDIERGGGQVEVVVGDAADAGNSERLLSAAARRFGGFDVVFANAGYGTERGLLDLTPDEVRRMFEVNFFASVELLRAAAQHLIAERRRGHLLLCSSALAKFTLPYFGVYAATKAAQAMVARSLRFELEPHGIEVSSVHPITTVTEFFEQAQVVAAKDHGEARVPAHAPSFFVQRPERVARAIVQGLRRPRSEIWTSHIVRLSTGVLNAFPFVLDAVLRREARRTRNHAS
ncbi:MAG: SDR family NAD(P)-dependent oxidoreductase [Phycisphaeraceae bacterium]|nr:SDR family NAD(P)-dependent oxidoreductase [Phycisphaeraceae bacterium]